MRCGAWCALEVENECHSTTFIFNGHCYNTCPSGTYMVPEEPIQSTAVDDNRVDGSRTPDGDFQSLAGSVPVKRCASCDPSCLRCRGSRGSDCLGCHPGYQLRVITADESFCYALSERSSGNNSGGGYDDYDDTDLNNIYMLLIIIVPAITLIVILVVIALLRTNGANPGSSRKTMDYSYAKLAVHVPSEEAEEEEARVLLKSDDEDDIQPLVHQQQQPHRTAEDEGDAVAASEGGTGAPPDQGIN